MATSTLNPDDTPDDKTDASKSPEPLKGDADFMQGLRLSADIEQETKAAQTYADNAVAMFKKFQDGEMSKTQAFALTIAWWKPAVKNMYVGGDSASDYFSDDDDDDD